MRVISAMSASLLLSSLAIPPALCAPLGTALTPFIKVDQLGYLPAADKVAIVVDPIAGFNGAQSYVPGTGTGQYQVRRWADDGVVFSGTLSAWHSGTTHAQSGDRGWWLDFSTLTTPGSYYLYDTATGKASGRFEIAATVYDQILRHVQRSYYYQRLGLAHVTPYADARWVDGVAYLGANQDGAARNVATPGSAASARDLRGGWMDAGDTNKYTTFAELPVIHLVEAYRSNPALFTDNLGIPESGNGRPDLLDELKWELDFFQRMQNATGTQGFVLKVGTLDYNYNGTPGGDTRPRYYVGECTSATLAGAVMFAAAGPVYRDRSDSNAYGTGLISRAEQAWARAKLTTSNFTSFQTGCDNGAVKSGNADRDADTQRVSALTAAAYLYVATGKAEYRSYVDSHYNQAYSPAGQNWWGPYSHGLQLGLLRYAAQPAATLAVANAIRSSKAQTNNYVSLDDVANKTDLYRAQVENNEYNWGHNVIRSRIAAINQDFAEFGINPTSRNAYRQLALEHLHWLHGANPLGLLMFSNMNAYGAESSVNELHHQWYADGSVWDNCNDPLKTCTGHNSHRSM